jgi:hypothetical protein
MSTENTENNEGKVAKNFEATMKKLIAIVGGEKNLFPSKRVSKDTLKTVVDGLLKDKKEAAEKEVKAELVALLDNHVEMKKAIEAKTKELKQLEEQKMKEFNEAASKVFNKIDAIGDLEKDYYSSLTGAAKAE